MSLTRRSVFSEAIVSMRVAFSGSSPCTSRYGRADRSKVDVLGFKEVLWHRVVRAEVDAFFDWFEMVFPDAHYVLNQRDHASVSTSGFWQNQEEQRVMRTLRRVEDMQQFLRETRPDRTHDVRYERITSEDQSVKDKELRGLAEFVLGQGAFEAEARGRDPDAPPHLMKVTETV